MSETKKYTLKIRLSDGTTHSISFDVPLGPEGNPGESAYEAAVKGGYTGTLEQFYEDLAKTGQGSGGGVDFETDDSLTLEDGILSVNVADQATEGDSRPITSGAVYNEFSMAVALLKTI